MKVLQIDDNPDITKFVDMTATSMGHEFSSAINGRDGLKMIEDSQYDLVFLDLSMPEFSGIDVINELVSKNLIQNQRIVLFTASAGVEGDLQELLKKGVHSYLAKPVDIDVLIDKIDKIQSEL